MTLSPASWPARTFDVVGSVNVGVAAFAGAVIVYFPLAVLEAIATLPVDVPGIPRTGAVVYAGAADDVVLFPNNVPPPALLRANVSAGVVVAVATLVVNNGDRFPAENVVTVPEFPATQESCCGFPPSVRRNVPEAPVVVGRMRSFGEPAAAATLIDADPVDRPCSRIVGPAETER
jgi:hypothetical protein